MSTPGKTVLSTRIGLANLGNTCFLNATLQALRLSPPIGEIFLGANDTSVVRRTDSKKREMASAFQTLMRDFWSTPVAEGSCPTLVARGFLHSMHIQLRENDEHWYRPGQQADAAEALQYIMDSLHDAMYKRVKMEIVGSVGITGGEELSQVKAIQSWTDFFSKEYSPIVQNFNGQTQICIQCSACGYKSERYEPWLMIKAPIPGGNVPGSTAPVMTDCLTAAFEPEIIEDYQCDKCKERTKATMTNRISRLPPITILTLKRFTNTGQKICGKIAWDINHLDFSPWKAFRRDPFCDSHDPPIYETFAVIDHMGSSRGGHYIMHAKQNDEWIEYDDSGVRPAHPDRIVNEGSYIAFLMPKTKKDSMNADFARHIEELRNYIVSLRVDAAAEA